MLVQGNPAVPTLAAYPDEPSMQNLHGGRRMGGILPRQGMPPLVSIVTVVRNRAAALPRAMESVFAQDYSALEYIVVDGGSTDGTLDVIRRFEDRVEIWTSEPDAGISDAFNKGIAFSRGEIIGILNSDDWYEPRAVSASVRALTESGGDIAHGKLQYWEGGRKSYFVTGDARLLEKGMTIGHPTVFVRRRCYEHFGLFRRDFRQAMDYEWLLRAKVSGARFCFVNEWLANMQNGGLGEQRWRQSQKEVARARAIHLARARGPIPYWMYFYSAVTKGTIRRTLDTLHLGAARRWYHRHLSSISISEPKE